MSRVMSRAMSNVLRSVLLGGICLSASGVSSGAEQNGTAAAVPSRRDPFRPASAAVCADASAIASWRLKGTIGGQNGWTGWLMTPERPWLMVRAGDDILAGAWRVSRLSHVGVRLTAAPAAGSCHETSVTLSLRQRDIADGM